MQKQKRLRDRKYLDSFRDVSCMNCGIKDGTVVPAHIRWGNEGGMGLKPPDDLTLPLCFRCHSAQEANPGPEFWATVLKQIAKRRYRVWRRKGDHEQTIQSHQTIIDGMNVEQMADCIASLAGPGEVRGSLRQRRVKERALQILSSVIRKKDVSSL